ncbi:MAG: hypothetical protein VX899_13645 [Myxococcota bacterium]|nr:hypothetical protein [Myxococcota bacterium]
MFLTLLMSTAHATVGADIELRVLGYEPVDQKVYLLESGGERERLLFRSPESPDWVWAQSWSGLDDAVFYERLVSLQARLEPLAEADLSGLAVTEIHTAQVPCPQVPEGWGCQAWSMQVHLSLGSRQTQWTQVSKGRSGVVGGWSLPTGELLVMYRHLGLMYEGGYFVDRAALLK